MIHLTDIKKIYRMGEVDVAALKGLTLTVEECEYIAILGPSGSGKSTLMHIMGCLDTPTEGAYRLAGRDVGSLNRNRLAEIRNEKIGFVFQSFNLLSYATALENVELPMIYGKCGRRRERGGPKSCWRWWDWETGPGIVPPSFPGASVSGSPSREPWPTIRRSSWPTNPPATWTPAPARRSSGFSIGFRKMDTR